ncbi:hypothetical protein [Lederbergia ruris]
MEEVKVEITALLEIENVTIAGVADEFTNGAVATIDCSWSERGFLPKRR